MALDLLGAFELRAADGSVLTLPHKYRALLAFLAMPAGRSHSRDGLTALLWGELPHHQARAALRQALWALRRTLGRDGIALVLDGDHVALDAGSIRVDAAEFARAASAASDADSLARAAALYRGPFLAGLSAREAPFEEWLVTERERLAELAVTTLSRVLALQHARGALDDAVQTGLRLLALDPLQELVHRTLMQIYVQLGRRSAALRQYQSCLAILQRELRVEPDARTRALYQDILRQRSTAPTPAAPDLPIASSPPTAVFETPLIGREREMTLLRDQLNSITTSGGRVIAVVGEAGIGKSRLVGEFQTEAARTGARILVGRAHETHGVLPLAPWADALRRGRLADDPNVLGILHPAWRAEIARFVPDVSRPGPPGAHGANDDVRMFEAVVQLVTALAARSALVIVLEDLHWADDMSLRLASFVARRIDQLPVLLVLTAREEELDAGSSFHRMLADLSADGAAWQLPLPRLDRDRALCLVQALVGPRDDTTVDRLSDRIWTASEGHPFMIVEMVRALREAPAMETGSISMPQRVRRLIEHRFERLGATARQILWAAAVIGRDFPYALVQRASGIAEDDTVAGLEELVRRRVVHAVGDRFEFTHDGLREVAYGSLLPPRRKLLHRRVAEALESLAADDLAEHHIALGAHYAEAELWEKAAHRLYDAAHAARERTAYREAITLLERALGAVARLPRTREASLLEIDIRLRLFRSLNPLGDSEAESQVARARALLAESPDESREAIILVEVAELRRFARDLDAAMEAGQRALALATKTEQPGLVAQAHFQLGVAYVTRGAYAEGIGHLKSTVAQLADAPLGDQLGYPFVTALCRLTWSFADLGEFAEASRYADDARRIAEQSQHMLTLAEASTALGVLSLAQGHPTDAIVTLERALELARTWQVAYIRAFGTSWLALAYARCGRTLEATALLDECESGRMWEHVRLQWSRMIVRLAEARLLLGDAGRARALAEQGLALARSIGEPAGEAEALALLADIALKSGADRASLTHLAEATALARRLGLRPLEDRLQSLIVATQART